MIKKVLMLLSLALFQVVFLSGCKQTPQEVKERQADYGDNSQRDEEVELEYCTLDELKKIDLSDIKDGYNVNLPDKFDCSGISEIGVLDMQNDSGHFDLKDKYVELFEIDEDTLNYEAVDEEKTVFCYSSDDRKTRRSFTLYDNGGLSYVSDLSYDIAEGKVSGIDTYETYNTYYDDISDKTIDFDGKSVPFGKIIDSAADWSKEHLGIQDMEYGVTDIYARNIETKKGARSQMTLLLGMYYKGVLLDPYMYDWEEDGSEEDGTYKSIMKVENCNLKLNCDGMDKFSYVSRSNKYKINSVKSVDKVITPECAIRIINKYFSGFNKIDVSEFRVIYGLIHSRDDKGDSGNNTTTQVEGRPVYAFWINKENNGISDFGINVLPEHYIYVDMITGQITTDYEIEEQNN